MSKSNKKLSRRDAIKLLGAAAGATLLANLPSKWSKPSLTSGVLPAHAQTSVVSPITYLLTCGNNANFTSSPFNGTAGLTLNPGDSGINMDYLITCSCNGLDTVTITPLSNFGTEQTGPGGVIAIPIQIQITPSSLILGSTGSLNIFWSFNDPSQGFNSCTQTFSWTIAGVIP